MIDKKSLIIYSTALMDPLIISGYNPLVQVLKADFNVNIELIALSLTFHMLPFALMCLFTGTLSDLYYRPRLYMYGLILSTFGSLLGAFSPNISIFLLSRIVQGIASSLIMPIASAIIGDVTPKEGIGKAMGLFGVFISAGSFAGPLISGFLAGVNWRLIPIITGIYSLVGAIFIRMLYGAGEASQGKGTLSYVFQQFKHANRNILLVSIGGFILFFSYQGIQPLISETLSLSPHALSNAEIGLIFAAIGFMGLPVSFIGGLLIDKIGSKKTMLFSFSTMMPIRLLLILADKSLWPYVISLLTYNSINRVAFNALQALSIETMPQARGTGSSIFNFIRFIGFGLGPMLSTIYLLYGMDTIWLATSFLLSFGILCSVLLRLPSEPTVSTKPFPPSSKV